MINRDYKLYELLVFYSNHLALFNRAIVDCHLRTSYSAFTSGNKALFQLTFTKMAAHNGIRSCDDPASVAPRVVVDETKSVLLDEIQRNATQIRHHRRYHHRCRHRYVNGDYAASHVTTRRVAEMWIGRSPSVCNASTDGRIHVRRRYRDRGMELVKHIGRFLIS